APDRPVVLFTDDLPAQAAVGDRLGGVGVVIGHRQRPDRAALPAVASAAVEWFPVDSERTGWRLLAGAGVDVGRITGAARRDRQPLAAEDAEAFYALLAAAQQLGSPAGQPLPPAQSVAPLPLLQTPQAYA